MINTKRLPVDYHSRRDERYAIPVIATTHRIVYKGVGVTITGKRELALGDKSNMKWLYTTKDIGVSYGSNRKKSLKDILDIVVANTLNNAEFKSNRAAFITLRDSLDTLGKIQHSNFRYGRFRATSSGNYYFIYWTNPDSPTGEEIVGQCTEAEWEGYVKLMGRI